MRAVPHPLLSLALFVMWLMLTRLSPGQAIIGAVLALLAGRVFARLEPAPPGLRAIVPLVRLAGIVGIDIARSNIAVAALILNRDRGGERRAAFVEIPLRLRNPAGLALLAMIVTATPGTAWLDYDGEAGTVLLHVLDMMDAEELSAMIRDRYEAPLLEAFA